MESWENLTAHKVLSVERNLREKSKKAAALLRLVKECIVSLAASEDSQR